LVFSTLSLHDALPIFLFPNATSNIIGIKCVSGLWSSPIFAPAFAPATLKYLNAIYFNPYALFAHLTIFSITNFDSPYGFVGCNRSEEHTSELQSRFDL